MGQSGTTAKTANCFLVYPSLKVISELPLGPLTLESPFLLGRISPLNVDAMHSAEDRIAADQATADKAAQISHSGLSISDGAVVDKEIADLAAVDKAA